MKHSSTGYKILGEQFFTFSTLNLSSIVLWSLLLLMRSPLLILLGFSCMWWVILFLLIFFLFVVFIILILMYLGVDVFAFFLLGGCWASWMYLVFFINLGSFQLLFLWRFFYPFLLFWDFHCEYVGAINGVPHYSEVLLIFLPPPFFLSILYVI